MIEVKNLVKKYGDHLAVNNLSFTVEKGQIFGFLGVNGAGKSTTMNIMTGYLSASSGTVLINGHDIADEPEEAKKCIGYLPEIPPLYTDMTVVEYLDFCAEIKKIPRKERHKQVDEVIIKTKLEDVATRMIRNLSKGYRQRVGLAQAILGYPEILILDEPTVGLDPRQIIEIRELILELAKEHTIILSSHIMQEVSAVCDHIMIISHGCLVASDTPENLRRMVSGDHTVELTVLGEPEKITQALSGICADASVEVKQLESGECSVTFRTPAEDRDYRSDIFYAMSDVRCPIIAMSSKKLSLEDIFLELTETNPAIEAEGREIEAEEQPAIETAETLAEEEEPQEPENMTEGNEVE